MDRQMVARAVAKSELFCMERQFLDNLDANALDLCLEPQQPESGLSAVTWLRLTQVGQPEDSSQAPGFEAMQRILFSAHVPEEQELLFLVVADKGKYALYVGLRRTTNSSESVRRSEVKHFADYVQSVWPGLMLTPVKESEDDVLPHFKEELNGVGEDTYDAVRALTGIPSMQVEDAAGEKCAYPGTIDQLLMGMSAELKANRRFAYLVIARPVNNSSADEILLRCRDLAAETSALEKVQITQTRTSSHTEGSNKSQSSSQSGSTGTSDGTSDSRGTSNTNTTSRSHTSGTSDSHSTGSNESYSHGTSSNQTHSASRTAGSSYSMGATATSSESRSRSRTDQRSTDNRSTLSKVSGFVGGLLSFVPVPAARFAGIGLSMLGRSSGSGNTSSETTSSTQTRGVSQSTSRSASQSETRGTSQSLGSNQNWTSGSSTSDSHGTTESDTEGTSESRGTSASHTVSHNVTETLGWGATLTEGTQWSDTDGTSQSVSLTLSDPHITATVEHLQRHATRLEQGKALGLWQVGVYMLSDQGETAQSASQQMRSLLSGQESVFEPVRSANVTEALMAVAKPSGPLLPGETPRTSMVMNNTLGQFKDPRLRLVNSLGERARHPLTPMLGELRSLLTTRELSYYINFPRRNVPGIGVIRTSPEFALSQPLSAVREGDRALHLGLLLDGGQATTLPYHLSVGSLSSHTLVAGLSGGGKTTTIGTLLRGSGLPFLILEPAKDEWVRWAQAWNERCKEAERIDIYVPGVMGADYKQLCFNPLQPHLPERLTRSLVTTHVERLKAVLQAAFPTQEILPTLLEAVVYRTYKQQLSGDTVSRWQWPTLETLRGNVEKVIGGIGYREDIAGNMKACLTVRLDSLLSGWKRELLLPRRGQGTALDDLFTRRVVVNLSHVGDAQDKAFVMNLLLLLLREWREAEADQEGYSHQQCRHLTVVEEAHRVMRRVSAPESPLAKSSEMLGDMLSEVRAYGEGMILADQIPTRLLEDALKNTGLKIAHRLVSWDDQKSMSDAMGLTEAQGRLLSKLLPGQAIVSAANDTEPHWLQVDR